MIPSIFLDKIKTSHYGSKIIISIDDSLIKLTNSDKIEFQSAIQDGKYVLIGPNVLGSILNQSKPREAVQSVKAV